MGKKKRRAASPSKVVRIPFQQFITGSMTAGSLQTQLTPANMGCLAEIYTGYDLYKFTRLEYQLQPRPNATTDNPVTFAYYPEAVITAPGTVNAAMENLDCIVQMDGATMPTRWHKVPAARLRGQISWYKCQPDAAATEFEVQGILQAFGSSTEAVYAIVRGVCEFKNPVDSTTALKRIKDLVRVEILQEFRDQAVNASCRSPGGVKQGPPSVPGM